MIKTLNGTKETVDFPVNSTIRLYDNVQEDDYPLHWHTSMEIIMPIDNIYTVYCNESVYVLNEGEILFISPCVLHRLTSPDSGRRYIILADLSQLDSMNEFKSLAAILTPVVHVTPANSPKIYDKLHRLLHNIAAEYENESLFRDTVIYSKLISIFALIGRNRTTENKANQHNFSGKSEYFDIFLSVCDYINNHFYENITLDQAAGLAGFSKYHFSRIFKHYADISFYQYLNRKRIMHAATLLMEPDITVSEVAKRCGFVSISAFIRMFKIQKGYKPSEFREMQSKRNNVARPQ